MLADFFTKPLQGNMFRKIRGVILGHNHIDTLEEITSATSQERVGEDKDVKKVGGDKDGDGANVQRADVQRADGIVREPLTTREHHVAPYKCRCPWKHIWK
jgi:hypothetical protein